MADNTNETMEKANEIIEKEEKIGFFTKVKNGAKSRAKKVKTKMSEHPIATAVGGAIFGSAATIGGALLLNKALNKDRGDEDLEVTDIPEDGIADVENVEDDTNVDI